MANAQRWYATGRRKESSARVYVTPGTGQVVVNDRDGDDYFRRRALVLAVKRPFEVTDTMDQFDVKANVDGGGLSGQAGAIEHGISRALTRYDEELRPPLKRGGFLTRDARKVERKKYGRPKARKRSQFSKR